MAENPLTPEETKRIWRGETWEDMDPLVEAVCLAMKQHLWTGQFSPVAPDLNEDEIAFLRTALDLIDLFEARDA
jgi:hypothetical protein